MRHTAAVNPHGFETMVAGLREAVEITQSGPLHGRTVKSLIPDYLTGQGTTLRDAVRRWSQTAYHPTSTCAMGSGEDAVVDELLRVRGVEGLRVVDASVMPAVTRANTNSATVMIAEKAADVIMERSTGDADL
ncbi:GMC oxidoreductase [Streptomyces sp. NPDC054775]